MVGLTKRDIYMVVNRYIGVSGGYLGDFSYRTHAEFYGEYCNLDIDPNSIDGTTRSRFIQILEGSDPLTQAAILRGVSEKYPEGSDPLRTPESFSNVHDAIARCLSGAGVRAPQLRITSEVVRLAITDAETLLERNGPTSAVDRVHTALHGYLKAACEDASIACSADPSILDLFKLLKQQHPRLQIKGQSSKCFALSAP